MPIVPYQRQVAPSPSPDLTLGVRTTAEDFGGAIGQGVSDLGQGVAAVADQRNDEWIKEKEEENLRVVGERMLATEQEANQGIYQGQNAIGLRELGNAAGAVKDTQELYKQLREKHAEGLTPAQLQLYNRMIDPKQASTVSNMMVREAGQLKAAKIQQAESGIDLSIQDAVNKRYDDKAIDASVEGAYGWRMLYARAKGSDSETTNSDIQNDRTRIYQSVIEGRLADDNPKSAQEYFESVKDKMDSRVATKVQADLKNRVSLADVQETADLIWETNIIAGVDGYEQMRNQARELSGKKREDVLRQLDGRWREHVQLTNDKRRETFKEEASAIMSASYADGQKIVADYSDDPELQADLQKIWASKNGAQQERISKMQELKIVYDTKQDIGAYKSREEAEVAARLAGGGDDAAKAVGDFYDKRTQWEAIPKIKAIGEDFHGKELWDKMVKSGQAELFVDAVQSFLPEERVPTEQDIKDATSYVTRKVTNKSDSMFNVLGMLNDTATVFERLSEGQQPGVDFITPVRNEREKQQLIGQLQALGVSKDVATDKFVNTYNTMKLSGASNEDLLAWLKPAKKYTMQLQQLTEKQKIAAQAGYRSQEFRSLDVAGRVGVVKFKRANETPDEKQARKAQFTNDRDYPAWAAARAYSAGLEADTPKLWVDAYKGNRAGYNQDIQKVKQVWPEYGRALDEMVTWLASRGEAGARPVDNGTPMPMFMQPE